METSRCLRIGVDGFISRCGKQYGRDKVRPAPTVDGNSTKTFAQRGQNGPKWTFIACWASFFAPTGTVTRPRSSPSAPRPGRSMRACPLYWRNLLRTRIGYRHPANLSAWPRSVLACLPRRRSWGFCSIRKRLSACRRRVGSLMMQFPPINGVQAMTHEGWCPKRRPPR